MTLKCNQLSAAAEKALAALPSAPRTILLVDDEHLPAAAIAATLTGLGYTVLGPVGDAQAALDLARQQRPDLAVLDICLPGTTGLALAETLAREFSIPAVLVSGYADDEYVQGAVKCGALGYLLKPVSADQFRVALPIAWSRHLAQRKLAIEAQDAQTRLEQRKVIERAKGLLMKRQNLTEEEAMRTLQRQARDSRRPMVEVAQELIAADASPPADGPAKS